MDYALEFASTAFALAFVALGLLILQRSHGLVILEMIPMAAALTLLLLSLFRPATPSTLQPEALLIPGVVAASMLAFIRPLYGRWRLRVAGESTTLLLSFSIMNCCFLAMSIATNGKSVPIGFADSFGLQSKLRLQLLVILLAAVVLGAVRLYLAKTQLIPALQLAKDDYRLLLTFGRNVKPVKSWAFALAALMCVIGMLFFVSLQETFAVLTSYAVLIPAFAIAILQTRIRLTGLLVSSMSLVSAERLLTEFTSELLRQFNQALLFCLLVLVSLAWRSASASGRIAAARRRLLGPARLLLC